MEILLISPKVDFSTNITELNRFWIQLAQEFPQRNTWSGIGTSLITIAALTPPHYNLSIIDENFTGVDFSKSYDIVGITLMTQQADRAYMIADNFRLKNITVVLGGIHATLMPNEAKLHADAVVIGEAEYTWNQLLDDFSRNKLKPFYKSEIMVDMAHSPVPRFDLINHNNYKYIWLQASRGCPHDCSYCCASKVFGKGYRTKNVGQIIKEIEYIHKLFPQKPIFFADDNFLAMKGQCKEILSTLQRLKINWQAQCDISIAQSESLLSSIKESGCTFLFIGLESLNIKSLESIDINKWKAKNAPKYREKIDIIQRHGIGVIGAFMVGFDDDDISTFKRISDFIAETNMYHSSITILTPFPETGIRRKLEEENRLLTSNWSDLTGYNVTFRPKNMSITQLEEGIIAMYKRVYDADIFLSKMNYFKNIHKRIIAHSSNQN